MRRPIIFISIWFILSLLQTAFVRLASDEGYYWFYSTRLQWGYYDHPPLIAAMIRLGYSIFENELGVRLMNTMIMSGSLLLFFLLLPEKFRRTHIAFLLLLSQPLLHYFSFIAFPDAPLIFFSMVFLFGYKRWLDGDKMLSALLMGISMAGMLYSKYLGVLVVLFVVLSNLHVLRSKWFWMAGSIAVVLSLPHFWWQLQNGFPSFEFHLQKRTRNAIDISLVGQYISQQIPAFGPAFLIAAIAGKAENVFERSLRFVVLGSLVFFLLISFRSFIHFHWTSIAIMPALYLSIKFFTNKKRQTVCYLLTIPFVIIILLFRIHTVHSFLPFSSRDIGLYQFRDKWANEISTLAADRPVVFTEDFREAGLYSFYSKKTSLAVFNNYERRTQYDLWAYEDSVQGKPALIVDKRKEPQSKELSSAAGKKIYYRYISSFQSYYNIPVDIRTADIKNNTLRLSLSIVNSRPSDLRFIGDTIYGSPKLFYRIIDKNNAIIKTDVLKTLDNESPVPTKTEREYFFITPGIGVTGDNRIEIGFEASGLPASINGRVAIRRS